MLSLIPPEIKKMIDEAKNDMKTVLKRLDEMDKKLEKLSEELKQIKKELKSKK